MRRLKGEHGFGLIELLMAMTMLNIGVLAIIAAFNSGIVSLARSSHISTGAVLADQQMELYRGLTYPCIYLLSGTIPSAGTYVQDTAFYSSSQVTSAQGGTCSSTPPANATNASRTLVGPDHHSYRVDAYIVSYTPSNGRAELKVSVAVRDGKNTAITYAREQSTFDQSTGS